MKTNTMIDFTNLYSLSKTLRFELKPVGKTLENIEKKGLLSQDEQRSENYQSMKKVIDGFHKYFIELAMSQVKLTYLEKFEELYHSSAEKKKDDGYKKELEKVQNELRKEIVKGFKSGEAYSIFSKIDKKELFTELLNNWVEKLEDKKLVDEFKSFTTYFTGFHENRKNMYSDKVQSTAIAYRLIHENLPKFLDNIKVFEQLKEVPELIDKTNILYKEIEAYLNIRNIEEAFELSYYNEVLTQKQIDIYNLIIGGRTAEEGKKKIQGLNEYINLYNQKQERKNRIPKLKILYKQILSDRDSISFLPESFEDDAENTASQKVLDAINAYYLENLLNFKPKDKDETENVLEKCKELLSDLKSYDLSKIYIRNDKALTDISQAIFGDWGVINAALSYSFIQSLTIGKNGITAKQEAEKEKFLKQSYFTISELESALFSYKDQTEVLCELKEGSNPIADYFKNHFKAKEKESTNKEFDFIANIDAKYSCIKGILNSEFPKDKKLNQDKKVITDIKAFLDALMELLHFVKPLTVSSDSTLEKEQSFYNQFDVYYEQLQFIIPLYNKVRNFSTQKAYSTSKYKLNFENSYFLNGWIPNYDSKAGIIYELDGNYYLAINDKKLKPEEIEFLKEKNASKMANRISLDFQKPDNTNTPRMFIRSKGTSFAPAVSEFNLPVESIIDIYDGGKFKTEYRKTNPIEYKKSLTQLIEYFKLGFTKHHSYKHFDFKWKKSNEYNDIAEFYHDSIVSCYNLNFEKTNWDNLMEYVNQGKLYLFQIYNKDFSPFSKGKPNMHTLYWKALFDPENLKNVVYKLNGQAEVFYRKKSIDKLTIHKANEPIENKNPKATKKHSKFEYELIKDKRYTVDKFQFHVPITINFKAAGNDYINDDVLSYLKNNPDVNII